MQDEVTLTQRTRKLVDWRDFLNLKDEEFVIDERIVIFAGGGRLVLTNQRLVHLKSKGGFFSTKSYEMINEIPLESIKSVDCKSVLLSTGEYVIVIYTADGKLGLTLVETSSQSQGRPYGDHFKEKILSQMKERRQELERRKTPAVIDFSFLKTIVEKGGLVLTTLKCPDCNAPIRIPKNGTQTSCEHCGSVIHAVDLFEKFKKTIE